MSISMSCCIASDTFQERTTIYFKDKKYQKILDNADTDEYGPREAITSICETAKISGADLILVIDSCQHNSYSGVTKDRKKRFVPWSKYKKEKCTF